MLFTVGDKDYRLSMDINACIAFENFTDKNPLMIFANASKENPPKISDMAAVLWASLQRFNHKITREKATDIYNQYVEEGHSPYELLDIIVKLYQESGLIPKDAPEDEPAKNE